MPYCVKGVGPDGPLSYSKEELWEAAYTAEKMADQGVREVQVFDDQGRVVDISNAPLPPGWRRGPFKRSDFP